MPVYVFRCRECGESTSTHPMSAIPSSVECPTCPGTARRVFTAPHLGRGGSPAMRLLDSTGATADTPQVVSALPSSSPRKPARITTDPRHAALPRP